jgi:hypothetical protein
MLGWAIVGEIAWLTTITVLRIPKRRGTQILGQELRHLPFGCFSIGNRQINWLPSELGHFGILDHLI